MSSFIAEKLHMQIKYMSYWFIQSENLKIKLLYDDFTHFLNKLYTATNQHMLSISHECYISKTTTITFIRGEKKEEKKNKREYGVSCFLRHWKIGCPGKSPPTTKLPQWRKQGRFLPSKVHIFDKVWNMVIRATQTEKMLR